MNRDLSPIKDLAGLQNRIQASALKLVVQRHGASVFEALTSHGPVFVKATTDREACHRHGEILEALGTFSLAPSVLEALEWDDHAILVLSALDGERLDRSLESASRPAKLALLGAAGAALGELHRAITPARLLEMEFWQRRDGSLQDPGSWHAHLGAMISKWMSRINPNAPDYPAFKAELDALLRYCADLREPAHFQLLHCDSIGRNILVDAKNRISGILDFEAAGIGDAAYDLAKIVWADMDFSDIELRNSFLGGWETTYGESIPKRNFFATRGCNAWQRSPGQIRTSRSEAGPLSERQPSVLCRWSYVN